VKLTQSPVQTVCSISVLLADWFLQNVVLAMMVFANQTVPEKSESEKSESEKSESEDEPQDECFIPEF
jgi:hypothetical protein